ncbi:hypothetical protein BJX62DRAFT_234115 [Aspergillus germanicus]
MKTRTILSLGLLGCLQITLAVKLNITEVKYTDGRPQRTAIVDLPYIDDSVLPKDQPCPELPFFTREIRLMTETLTVPTKCYIKTEQCHNGLYILDNEEPYVYLTNGAAKTVRCFEEDE